MPPIRTQDSHSADSPVSKQSHRKRSNQAKQKEGAPPGVSKIKSALRQTRRLLAKGDLRADVRVEAERKLKALEADLAAGERANKERALATRYHKIKFFDRQKLLRKIKQTKKRLEDEENSSKARKALKVELFDLRVDLNYVMNYPKLEKYISLFPPEVRTTEGVTMHAHSVASTSATDEKREKLREWVRTQMRAGEMSNEPETLEHRPSASRQSNAGMWKGLMDKNRRGTGAEEGAKARQAFEVQDEFFEDDDVGNEGDLDAGEPADTRTVESPTERRPDEAASHPDKHPKPSEKHRKKEKHQREAASPRPIRDSFFGDGDESE